MPADTFDTDPATLPPLTAAIVQAARWARTVDQPVLTEAAARALIDAVHSLEQRVIALGG